MSGKGLRAVHERFEIAQQRPSNDGVVEFVSSAALRVDAVGSSEFMSRELRAIFGGARVRPVQTVGQRRVS